MLDFTQPDLLKPLNVDERIAATPATAVTRGMYIQKLVDLMAANGVPPTQKFVAFKNYPIREFMRYIADASRLLHPRQPIRQAMCTLGRLVFPTLQESLALRVIFAFAGNNYEAALKRVADGYSHSQSPGAAHLAHFTPGEAIVELRNVWNFPDCYQIGVHEGALTWYQRNGTIELRVLSPCDVDLRIRWK
jgi:uncharacterized protein (TIGR02265 family)